MTDSSRRQYQRAWAVFRQFYCRFYGSENPILPLVPNCIPLFISYLSFPKMAYSTITSYLSAIFYVHKLKGLRDPTKSEVVDSIKSATSCRRSSSRDEACVTSTCTVSGFHQLFGMATFSFWDNIFSRFLWSISHWRTCRQEHAFGLISCSISQLDLFDL